MGRDLKGRFVRGNKEGNRFDKSNQPGNAGRKCSRFKAILGPLESIGEVMSYEDYQKATITLLTLTADELTRIAEDKSTPIAIILIANAISGDLSNQRIDNLERFLDRIFGKTTNRISIDDNTNQHQTIHITKTYESNDKADTGI